MNMHLRRFWAQAIILAIVELDAANMDADERLYWHLMFKGATA